jgi:hypothetical protein
MEKVSSTNGGRIIIGHSHVENKEINLDTYFTLSPKLIQNSSETEM